LTKTAGEVSEQRADGWTWLLNDLKSLRDRRLDEIR
jgi:hypothetical protein